MGNLRWENKIMNYFDLTRRMSLVEQEQHILAEHLVSPLYSLACRCRRLPITVSCLLVLYHLVIVLSVLRYTAYDYSFGIFKLPLIERLYFICIYNKKKIPWSPYFQLMLLSGICISLFVINWRTCLGSLFSNLRGCQK